MRILQTNDDGYKSRALLELAVGLKRHGHEPVIFAPANNVSGQGSALTIQPTVKIDIHKRGDFTIYAVHGTTTDCVLLGTRYTDVDLVISGPNYGPNLGKDTLNSATVGGAREAQMMNIPSIALSINSYYPRHLQDIVDVFCSMLDDGILRVLSGKYLLNINFPDLPANDLRGVKVVGMSKKGWIKNVTFETNKRGMIAHIKGSRPRLDGERGTDLYWVNHGYITVTPVISDLIDYNLIHELQQILECYKGE